MAICDSFFGSLCTRHGFLTCLILNSEASEQPLLPYRNLCWRPLKPESTYHARHKCGVEQTTQCDLLFFVTAKGTGLKKTRRRSICVVCQCMCRLLFSALVSSVLAPFGFASCTNWLHCGRDQSSQTVLYYENTRAGRSTHSVICYSLCFCTQCKDKEKQTTWHLCRLPVRVCCLLLSSALASLSFAWGTKPALQRWNVAQGRPEHLVNCVQYTYLHAARIW